MPRRRKRGMQIITATANFRRLKGIHLPVRQDKYTPLLLLSLLKGFKTFVGGYGDLPNKSIAAFGLEFLAVTSQEAVGIRINFRWPRRLSSLIAGQAIALFHRPQKTS